MNSVKYHRINKDFISVGMKFPFKIYKLNEDKKSVSAFLFRDATVTRGDLHQMEKAILYIKKEEQQSYDDFILTNTRDPEQHGLIAFQSKSKVILEKAEHIMHKLFQDPEALGNVEQVQDVVNDLVITIMDEDFTINALLEIASHDYYTHTHSINVSIYALSLGKHLNLPDQELQTLGESALMHDLGKSQVRADIINKNGKLTHTEFEHMQNHPSWGYDIAVKLGVKNEKILDGIRHHHEKLNGTGYPDRLQDHQISLFARIICICDIFDALTTRRSYKDPVTTFNTLSMMKKEMEHEIDERLLNSFILMMQGD